MTPDERMAIFKLDLDALTRADNAMVIFNLAHDEDAFAQFSHERAGDPLLCEVSNRSEGWNAHSLDTEQTTQLRVLGYEIPSPHHQANPHKLYSGDTGILAAQVEQVFRNVFRAPENYVVVSSGVES